MDDQTIALEEINQEIVDLVRILIPSRDSSR